MRRILLGLVLCLSASTAGADNVSGPEKGAKVGELKVYATAGDDAGKVIDIAATQKEKTTIYVFVQADLFTRPIGRFLKTLDQKVNNDLTGVEVIAVWLSDDIEKSREYLPRVQTSIPLARTQWTVFDGDKNGPPEWGINSDAHVTVVAAKQGVAHQSTGYVSINETVVEEVVKSLAE